MAYRQKVNLAHDKEIRGGYDEHVYAENAHE